MGGNIGALLFVALLLVLWSLLTGWRPGMKADRPTTTSTVKKEDRDG